MNKVLFDFYAVGDVDFKGRTLEDMISMTNDQLEKSHDVIQWMFPLNEKSNHNKFAPILDDETIEKLKLENTFRTNFDRICNRFEKFLEPTVRIVRTSRGEVNQLASRPHWVNPHDHNYLRITRVIKCCLLFGQTSSAESFWVAATAIYQKYPDLVGDLTKKYWDEAIVLHPETAHLVK